MSTVNDSLNECACGCGELTRGQWKRGHAARGEGGFARLEALPGPEGGDVDLGDADPGPETDPEPAGDPGYTGRGFAGYGPPADGSGPLEGPGEPVADEGPGHLSAEPSRGGSGRSSGRGGGKRVTAATRRDIHAKIRFVLVPAGKVWQARDPWCGGSFAEAEPDVSDALADIVCDSPDLVAFFTGPAGGFMKYVKLAMALQPVALTLLAHHITHAIGEDQGREQAPAEDLRERYAA